MAQTIRELMNTNLLTVPESASVQEAARLMRDEDIGDVLVVRDSELVGILSDRDVVVRVVAEGGEPEKIRAGDIASSNKLVTVSPDDPVKHAVAAIRDNAVRRVPVVEEGRLVGLIALADLAIERDEQSALADVSAARPNR